MKIKILDIRDTIVKFDIIGKGNVLMDYKTGDFDLVSIEDTEEADKEFENYILENIEDIIFEITKPSLDSLRIEVDSINVESFISELGFLSSEDKKILLKWIEIGLPILIEAEDYERCKVLTDLRNEII